MANNTKKATEADTREAVALFKGKQRKKELADMYRKEKKVPTMLSPMYRPYFGNVMRVMINGISIFFKVDGTTQNIPQTFADEIASRRKKVDAYIVKQNRMANVADNYDGNTPGELKLF